MRNQKILWRVFALGGLLILAFGQGARALDDPEAEDAVNYVWRSLSERCEAKDFRACGSLDDWKSFADTLRQHAVECEGGGYSKYFRSLRGSSCALYDTYRRRALYSACQLRASIDPPAPQSPSDKPFSLEEGSSGDPCASILRQSDTGVRGSHASPGGLLDSDAGSSGSPSQQESIDRCLQTCSSYTNVYQEGGWESLENCKRKCLR